MTEVQTGRVGFFSPKGYGFIESEDGSKSWFFHCSDFLFGAPGQRFVEVGRRVEFTVSARNGRTCAKNIRPLEPKDVQ
jgi:cold shock CspA family protein